MPKRCSERNKRHCAGKLKFLFYLYDLKWNLSVFVYVLQFSSNHVTSIKHELYLQNFYKIQFLIIYIK